MGRDGIKINKTIFILRQSTKCNKIHRHYNNSRQDIKAMDKLQSVWRVIRHKKEEQLKYNREDNLILYLENSGKLLH